MLDTLMLSRIQFAANISFHILFPTITIALAWMLVFFKWRYNRTQAPRMARCLLLLGQDIRSYFRLRCGIRHYDEFPVWYQLARLYGTSR